MGCYNLVICLLLHFSNTRSSLSDVFLEKDLKICSKFTGEHPCRFQGLLLKYLISLIPVDARRKLNAHKTFKRRPGRVLNVLCTFNLRPMFTGILLKYITNSKLASISPHTDPTLTKPCVSETNLI